MRFARRNVLRGFILFVNPSFVYNIVTLIENVVFQVFFIRIERSNYHVVKTILQLWILLR